MSLSVLIERRIARLTAISASVNTHQDKLVDGIFNELKSHVPKNVTFTKETVKGFVATLLQRYNNHGETMENDEVHLNTERGQDSERSSELEMARQNGYNLLLDLKSGIGNSYGQAQLKAMRITGRTPVRTQAIRRQLWGVVSWLEKKENDFPQTVRRFAQSLNKTSLLQELKPTAEALDKAIDAHAKDLRETEAALSNRDASTDVFDTSDSQTVDIVLALMNMAGMSGESEKLEPTLRSSRAGVSESGTSQPQDVAESKVESSPEETATNEQEES